jgi:glycine/D-amino acid oxidase-like deaminating enzyme/nitrite reductase/ring-hydroxylating ferredoxin subunit
MQAPAARSYWLREGANGAARHAALERDLEVDAAIVGAGITGLTLATLLLEAGLRVALLERRRVAGGTTSRSTAHLTAALDTDYCTLEQRFGEAALRTVADSVRGAIDQIERFAQWNGDVCGFRRVPGFRFSEEEAGAERLEKEMLCARRAGLDVSLVGKIPLELACASAMRFEQQGEIDPVAYCEALRERVLRAGGLIFEDTPVVEIEDGVARTAAGPCVRARHVIEAAHTAVGLAPSIQTRLGVYTSYVIAARVAAQIPRALYWDCADPYHYLRAATGDPSVILCGGADHRTGREEPMQRLRVLEQWLRSKLPVEAIVAQWSHEFFEPADGLPYIGFVPGSRDHLVAAGFSGTGLTFGTLGAMLIRDLVTRGASPWQEVYTPSRLKPLAAGRHMAREGLGYAWRFVADRLRRAPVEAPQLSPGGGCLLRIDGEQIAAFRDPEGSLHLLSPRCTHLGCIVSWNELEQTWDCPCHGGRFDGTGEPIYGPPVSRLERADVEQGEREPERI